MNPDPEKADPTGIAIIGMSGRFPGARSVAEFWENLRAGRETVSHFSEAELEYSAATPEELAAGVQFVRARGVLADVDLFDAEFFGIHPKEAELMDPQHRVFLECAWEALEDAGTDPEQFAGLIGVFASSSINSYLLYNLCRDRAFAAQFAGGYQVGGYATMLGNDKDFLPTRVSYKLNLRGPSMAIQTACSSSLVAICQAVQSLENFGCDVALAGGVSISFPQKRDYRFTDEGIVSPDGKCRPFDADARGTVFGHGAGIVVLKRLADALADGDTIHAVIKGAAVNNDGAAKVGYAAPSIEAQSDVVAMAQALAGVTPESITCIEAHGTGTPLGDPIEIAALTRAFRAGTARKNFCALTTAKGHIGHLDVAAGVTGLIKTALSLERRLIPPILHFQSANPKIDLADSPFYVAAKWQEWPAGEEPRRAGVSAFGVGGTNAHIVVEEAPSLTSEPAPPGPQLLLLSARSASALERAAENLAAHLSQHPDLALADVAYTTQVGRRAFAHRRAVVCADTADAIAQLKALALEGSAPSLPRTTGRGIDGAMPSTATPREEPEIVFLFPGQGVQQVGMGRELYATEPVFRHALDACCAILDPLLACSLRDILYPEPGEEAAAQARLTETAITQPALFAFEYALAQLWISWGVRPAAMLGHSVGEYVCACLAGVLTLKDALHLLAARARLMQRLPGGAMLAVRLPESEIPPLLGDALSLAAVNSPRLCVVSGPLDAVAQLEQRLTTDSVAHTRLATSHAFHSAMMDSIEAEFTELVRATPRGAASIPYLSNVTSAWITANETSDPGYWFRHLRQPVRFADGLAELAREPRRILLEVGPGQTLSTLARQQRAEDRRPRLSGQTGVPACPPPEQAGGPSSLTAGTGCLPVTSLGAQSGTGERAALLGAAGRLWAAGAKLDWIAFHATARRRRVPLPTYPFERKRFWVEPVAATAPTIEETTGDTGSAGKPIEFSKPVLAVVPSPQARAEKIAAKLRALLRELSGTDLTTAPLSASFFELGFDSLLLTQVSQAIQTRFGVKVTFRQMLEELGTLGSLVALLDKKLPAEAPALAPVPTPAALPRAVSTAPGDSALGGMLQQLQAMAQQIETLRTTGNGKPPVVVPVKADESKRFGPFKPLERGAEGALTPRQTRALAELTARYNRRTAKSKAYADRHRTHFCDPRAAGNFRQLWKEMVYPIVCERSLGSRIWDIDGNAYVDVTMGFGANYFGHSPEFVVAALQEQLALGFETGPQSPLAGEVAQLLCELTGFERVTFTSTGSEAVMAAIRVARTVTGRQKFVYFSGDYHGVFDEVLGRAALVDGQPGAMPIAPGIPHLAQAMVLAYDSAASLETIRAQAGEIAAVLVEPVQARHPDLQPREFLQQLRRLTEEHGIALIFDEMITGFRVAPGGAQEFFGVKADLATYGKIIGGGLPIGALAGRREYLDALDGGAWQYGDKSSPEVGVTFFAGTFVRHPLAMAAARSVLRHLRDAGGALQRETNERTARLVARLNAFFAEAELPMRLQHFSAMFYYDFHPDLQFAGLLFYCLRDRGVHIWEGRVGHLSTAHTDADIDFIVEAFRESVAELQAGGFLPVAVGAAMAASEATGPQEYGSQASRLIGQTGFPACRGDEQAGSLLSGSGETPDFRGTASAPRSGTVDFSVYFFGNYEAAYSASKYDTILSAAKFADTHGFRAIWLPERHFHAVGGFSPNPAVVAAALARETTQLQLRAGSVVLPLHHPVRVAEDWAVVDNLSGGRTGISIASGWHPNDFVFAPQNFERRRELCEEGWRTIQKLWRGEEVEFPTAGKNQFAVKLHPMPKQPELPAWLTCIHKESFIKAGELGLGVLSYTMNMSLEDLGAKIAHYRESYARHGHDPAKANVTILLHTFLDPDAARAREIARQPMCDYFRAYLDNSEKRLISQQGSAQVNAEDVDYLVERAFEDYVDKGKALIGSPETCAATIAQLHALGADEIGCFLDFGIAPELVLAGLEQLDTLRVRFAQKGEPVEIPLTESEAGLWLLAKLDEGASRVYNESLTLLLHGRLDPEALRTAVRLLVERHEGLRVAIDASGEKQRVLPLVEIEVPLEDFSHEPPATRQRSMLSSLARQEAELFDLARAPLMRASLSRLEPEEHVLLLTFHHLLGNGPSHSVFLRELAAAYHELAGGRCPAFSPAMPYREYVRWQAARETAESERYWLGQFAGPLPVLAMPEDHPRPERLSSIGHRQETVIEPALTQRLQRAATGQRVSMFMLLFSAYAALLHRVSGQEDVVIGVPFEGEVRTLPGGDALYANTTHMMPLRSRVDAATTFADHLRQTRGLVLDAAENQDYFVGRLIRALKLPRDPSRSPLFSATFNYETGDFRGTFGGADFEWPTETHPYRNPAGTATFELYLNVAAQRGGLVLQLDHSAIYEPATVQRWLRELRALLEEIANGPDSPLLQREPATKSVLRLWPSSPSADAGQTYDELSYAAMTNDRVRNAFFLRAYREALVGKTVVDIGTGKDAILARLAIEAGAKQVFAIELLERPARQAQELVRSLGLEDRIVVLTGDSRELALPEPAQACISDNLGHIGGAEAWDLILDDVRRRYLTPGALIIPGRCTTLCAATSLPPEFLTDPRFDELGGIYARDLFARAGYKYDLRLSITGLRRDLLSSTEDAFEILDFNAPAQPGFARGVRLEITRDGRIDGLALWLAVETIPGQELDALGQKTCWMPVYLPAFYPGLDVQAGDVIAATVRGELAENGICRDYHIAGEVRRKGHPALPFDFDSYHYQRGYRQSPFYRHLFRDDDLKTAPATAPKPPAASGDQERIAEWNRTERPFPHDQSIAELFAAQVTRAPQAVAVVDGDQRVSYADLDARAGQIAVALQARGVTPGARVALVLERSVELIAGLLGILKAGAAYVPLEPDSPPQRLLALLADSGIEVVLSVTGFGIPDLRARTQVLDLDALEDASEPPRAVVVRGEDVACVMFTSGSTGTPKGVEVPHRAIARLVINGDFVAFQASDVVAHASNPAFDAATFEVWGALLNGARLVIFPRIVLLDPARLSAELREAGVTTLFLTTSLFHTFAAERPESFASLDHLVVGGEALSAEAARRVLSAGAPRRLVNGYGPTETTTFAAWHLVERVADDTVSIPIGRPIANTHVHILDAAMQPVPIGVTGEIYIGGPGVARGYLRAPELTAERFVETAFGRLYKTGDLGRWRADGVIEFLGRSDGQMKLRGFRIEPGEITGVLQKHPAVRQAAVTLRDGVSGPALHAFLVGESAAQTSDAVLVLFLQQHLPEPMIPNHFTWLPALPLTTNGKLDQRALTEVAVPLREPATAPAGARNAVETGIAEIWKRALGSNGFSIHDDFFAIGGHSLLAIQVIVGLRQKFGVDVPVRRLFDTPTIKGIAEFIAEHLPPPPPPKVLRSLIAIQRGDETKRPLFLIPGGWGAEIEFLVYAQLKLHLGADLPIYGLKARGSDGIEEPHRSVREMVVDYVDEIRTRQPRGPYVLAGECIGGVVAYEMARRLVELGEKVALLALLDTERPSPAALRQFCAGERVDRWNGFWKVHVFRPFNEHMENLARLPLGKKLAYIWRRTTRKRRGGAANGAVPTPLDTRKVLGHYPRLLMAHPIGAYHGKVTLLIDETSHRTLGHMGWDGVEAGGLEVHILPGDHLSYIREDAAAAAAKLRELIERSAQIPA